MLAAEALFLPLSEDGEIVTAVLGAIHIMPLPDGVMPVPASDLPRAF